ncbi:MAG: hypothetical protein AAFQ80_04175 [Cyanobacteria bacterium J06621_8]
MTNLPNKPQNNLVSFLRDHQPLPPAAASDLEARIFNSLEPPTASRQNGFKVAWKIPSAIATGFLFTSVSLGWRTPQIALEPKDLENFLVGNWQNTLQNNDFTASEVTEAQWLLPAVVEPQPTLSVSAQ